MSLSVLLVLWSLKVVGGSSMWLKTSQERTRHSSDWSRWGRGRVKVTDWADLVWRERIRPADQQSQRISYREGGREGGWLIWMGFNGIKLVENSPPIRFNFPY